MRELLSKARARVIRHLVFDKGALALTIGMGGFVLLLLAGTQVLNWYWPVLLAVVSLGIGIYQLRRHVPSRYQLAQRIDNRMALADSLSTAVYFSEHPKPGLEAICAAQFHAAEGIAGTVNLEQALPMTRSRYLLPSLALLVIATSLFVVRYMMTGSLDLNGSMIGMAVDTFFSSPAEEAVAKSTRPDLRARSFDPSQPDAPSPEDPQQQPPPDAEKGKELLTDTQQSQENATGDEVGDEGEEGGKQESNDNSSPQDSNKQQDKSGREGEDKGDADSQGQDQRSMLDKLRDAVNNLMNKASSNESKQQNAKGGEKQKGQKSDKAGKSDESQEGEGDKQADASDQGDQGKNPQGKQSQAPGQKQGDQANAGQEDGKKALEDAKAEEAMGKISEILTERSAAISGEMMVEVGETKQQLRTAMTQQKAGHTDSGGEIHRDQVPLADQTFVERYFEEIRKPAKSTPSNSNTDTKAKSK